MLIAVFYYAAFNAIMGNDNVKMVAALYMVWNQFFTTELGDVELVTICAILESTNVMIQLIIDTANNSPNAAALPFDVRIKLSIFIFLDEICTLQPVTDDIIEFLFHMIQYHISNNDNDEYEDNGDDANHDHENIEDQDHDSQVNDNNVTSNMPRAADAPDGTTEQNVS